MNLITYTYYANYEIVELNNQKYIHCLNSAKDLDKEERFETKQDVKELVKAILELDLENEEDILNFTTNYGLLINTQNDPENPTYCGNVIPKEINNLISSFETGFSMSLNLFKYCISLIRNILHLSTEISLYADYKRNAHASANANLEYMNNVQNIVNYFFMLLYQPYANEISIFKGLNL